MQLSNVKVGEKCSFNMQKYMEDNDFKTFEEGFESMFGDNENLKNWIKNTNEFEIISIESGGQLDNGEAWSFIVVKPCVPEGMNSEDFKYQTDELEEPRLDYYFENYYLSEIK
tara:strand:+ start:367 stop:705 length:339 start_codon:yes stop_codon:yes gene_type:complete